MSRIIMSEKFQGKYRIPSDRWPDWDYSQDGAYFVTICTKKRIPYFGNLINLKIQLSEIGKIVHECWVQIPDHVPDVNVDEFVIMPDHIHGIIFIDCNVETLHATSLREKQCNYETMSRISPKSRSLPAII